MHGRVLLILLSLCVARESYSEPNEVTTVSGVLDRYEATIEGQSYCYIRSETQLEFTDNRSDKVDQLVARSRLYKRGGLVSLFKEGYRLVSDADERKTNTLRLRHQYLWDGKARYDISENEEDSSDDQYCYVSLLDRDSQSGESILQHEYPGHALEGYTFGDHESILTILREHQSLSRIHRADVNGSLCHVIEADIPGRGSYKIWFDPAQGYNICRAQVTRSATDIFLSRSVSSAFGRGSRIAQIEFILHDVILEELHGVWFPVEGRWQLTRTYENGDRMASTLSHRRLEIECGSDDAAFAEVFVPQARNGVVVLEEDTPHFLRRRWIDGKPRPAVNWPVVRATDSVVDEYITELTERGMTVSVMRPSTTAHDPCVPSEAELDEVIAASDNGLATKTRNHCGLYCIYAALRASGKGVRFTELLKPEYLGSGRGSAFSELKRAAQDFGLYGEPVEKLTLADLKASRYCSILHVKNSLKDPIYDHYVLFLGMEGDKAVLFDAPDLRRVPLCDIAPVWRGSGVLLSSHPIDVAQVVAPGRIRFIGWSLAALGIVVLVQGAKRTRLVSSWCSRQNELCLSGTQVATLGGIALAGALGYHVLADMGMIANWKGTTSVQKAHSSDFLPHIGLPRARSLLADGAVFVDSRFSRDYEAGCVPGAMSIPVDVNETRYEEVTTEIPLEAPIVVYCQSSRCGFAGQIAARLASDGYRRVSVFRGGWYEWVKHRQEDDQES